MAENDRLLNITDKDILLLKIFEAVVKAGGYTAAEACLNKSKSAISIHISTLETRLGKPLCYRGRSGFSLTPEGEQVYAICKDLFSDLNSYRERLNAISSLVGGVITVVLDDSVLGRMDLFANVLERFNTGSPQAFIELYVTSPERMMSMLLDGSADIGIGAIPKEIPGVSMHLLYEEELGLYCGDKHPLFNVEDNYISEDLLSNYQSVDFWAYQDLAIEASMETLKMTARSGQATARLMLILSGKWIGLLPRAFAQEWLAAKRIRELTREIIPARQKCYAVVRNEVTSGSLCKEMLQELKKALTVKY